MHALPSNIESMDKSWLAATHVITSPALDWTAAILSTIGWLGACFWLLALVLWLRGKRNAAFEVCLAMILGGIAAEVLKHLLHRIRPDIIYPQYVHLALRPLWDSKYSFPSGHAVLAAAASFGAVFALRARARWLLVLLTLAIAWSRVYEGMHWPSDVIAGLIIGFIAAVFSHLIMRTQGIQSSADDHNVVYRNRKWI